MTFDSFHLQGGTLDAVVAMGYEEPTPIQAEAIAPMLQGYDVVGQARTGTGKTAAFGIPMVDRLREQAGVSGVPGLILLPTRELALQVADVMKDIAKGSGLSIVPVYGGAGFGGQLGALERKGAKIVVACPGRLLDLIERGALHLDDVEMWVLDEADRMLDMGFVRDMRAIEKQLPKRRQTALFSATFPASVEKLVREFTNDPVRISVHDGESTVPKAEQSHARIEKPDKTKALMHYLHDNQPARGVVFTRTKHLAKRLAKKLVAKGWSAVALQGNMTQGQRERAMTAFRDGSARLLVATDVAARGLDVAGVTHVVNFDLPDPDSYVHRVGRTARNGAEGTAITFVQSDEVKDWKAIPKHIGVNVPRVDVSIDDEMPEGPDPKKAPGEPAPGLAPNGQPKHSGGSGHRRRQRQKASANRHGAGQGQRHGTHQGQRSGGGGGHKPRRPRPGGNSGPRRGPKPGGRQ